jgi:hypothetical protein
MGLIAEADAGARMGLDNSFAQRLAYRIKEGVRIVLKPSRPVIVRVRTADGQPVPGATVEAAEMLFRTDATAGPDGTATLRIPANAHVDWVVGFQPRIGFDYFENYQKKALNKAGPLPDMVMLTLDGAQSVRVKAVDSNGQPVPGIVIKPRRLYGIGKKDGVSAGWCATMKAMTDRQGIASFDWLPKGLGRTTFTINPQGHYSCPDSPVYDPPGPADLTAHVLRATPLRGTVRLPDGRPARQILVKASGWGDRGPQGNFAARTSDDGRYVLDVPPERAYIVAVVDDTWAARSLMNVALREGHAQNELDFTLIKGTLLHGRVTEGPDHRVSPGALVAVTEQGGLLPKDYRGVRGTKGELRRALTTTDANGRYQFRVGPGSFTVEGMNSQYQGIETVAVDVKNESELVRDVTLKLSRPETIFNGVVFEKTPTGERPFAKAVIIVWPLGLSNDRPRTDDQGRFELIRKPGEMFLYAYSADQGLAGFTAVSADSDHGKVTISKAASIFGRVIDTSGNPQARHRVGVRLASGPFYRSSGEFGITIVCDEQGRFSFTGAPSGSHGELSAPHDKDPNGRRTRARTVMPFDVVGLDPVEVPDLIIPAQKPER